MMLRDLMRTWLNSSVDGQRNLGLTTFFFKELFSSFSSFADDFDMGEFWCKFRGRWDSLIFSKLLKECWVIRIDGEILLCMLAGMMLPGRSTVPVLFWIVFEVAR